MSTRAERRRNLGQARKPPRRVGGTIAAVIAILAVIGIIVYAVLNAHRVVPSAAVAPNPVPSLPPPALVGSPAPPFRVVSRTGTISSNDLRGKPYLLELFATWCPHCQRETAVLRKIRAAIPESKFAMLSVTGSPVGNGYVGDQPAPESQQDVDHFDSQFSVTWPSFYDPQLSVAKAWGFGGFPQIFIVNRYGKIAFVSSGEIPEKDLLAAAKRVLR